MDCWQLTFGLLLLTTYIVLVVLNARRKNLLSALASVDIIAGLVAGVYLITVAFL